MASDSNSEASFLEQLISSRNRDLSLLLPLIFGFSNSTRGESPEPSDQETTERRIQDRIILINPFTQGMIVSESSRSLDSILREISEKDGLPPASKTSIDAMPKVEITEDFECAICLEGCEIGGEAREMPCKHKYHSNCIEKWLGIHGSCPVCRFEMPVDDTCKKRNGVGEEGQDRSFEREVWVSFSFNRRNSTTSTDSDSTSSNQTSAEDSVDVNGSSASTNDE